MSKQHIKSYEKHASKKAYTVYHMCLYLGAKLEGGSDAMAPGPGPRGGGMWSETKVELIFFTILVNNLISCFSKNK